MVSTTSHRQYSFPEANIDSESPCLPCISNGEYFLRRTRENMAKFLRDKHDYFENKNPIK